VDSRQAGFLSCWTLRCGTDCPTVLLVPTQDPPTDAPGGDQPPGDETWPTYTPPGSQPGPDAPESQPALPPTHVEYGKPQRHRTYPPAPGTSHERLPTARLVSTRRRGWGLVPIVLGVVVVPMIIGGIAAFRGVTDNFDEFGNGFDPPGLASEPETDVHSVAGFGEMLDALREETGSTTVFDAVLYPGYAVLRVPADKTSKREHSLYWDGDLRQTGQGTSRYARFDLSSIKPRAVMRLLDGPARQLVEDPTTIYAVIRAPLDADDRAWIYANATNDYQESGYLSADKNGKVLKRYLPE
jgi:hypothetical protein